MSLAKHFNRPRPIPLMMSVTAVVLLFGLGIWQLQRLAWKEAIIAELEQALANAPLQTLPATADDLTAKRFYKVQLEGEYVPEPEIHIAARYYRSQLGYHILNPFRLDDGRMVLVNRGWIPTQRKDHGEREPVPTGKHTILAQIRTSNERNPFTPINQPEKNVWFGRDVQEIGAFSNLNLVPVTLDLIGDQDPAHLPIPSTGTIKLKNDHLGYAITWFGVGIAVLVISLLYHRKKP